MSATPSIFEADRTIKIKLQGEMPSPLNPPSGCTFHQRCPYAIERCRRKSRSCVKWMAVRFRVTAPRRWGTWMPDVGGASSARRLRDGGRFALSRGAGERVPGGAALVGVYSFLRARPSRRLLRGGCQSARAGGASGRSRRPARRRRRAPPAAASIRSASRHHGERPGAGAAGAHAVLCRDTRHDHHLSARHAACRRPDRLSRRAAVPHADSRRARRIADAGARTLPRRTAGLARRRVEVRRVPQRLPAGAFCPTRCGTSSQSACAATPPRSMQSRRCGRGSRRCWSKPTIR